MNETVPAGRSIEVVSESGGVLVHNGRDAGFAIPNGHGDGTHRVHVQDTAPKRDRPGAKYRWDTRPVRIEIEDDGAWVSESDTTLGKHLALAPGVWHARSDGAGSGAVWLKRVRDRGRGAGWRGEIPGGIAIVVPVSRHIRRPGPWSEGPEWSAVAAAVLRPGASLRCSGETHHANGTERVVCIFRERTGRVETDA